MGYDNVEKYEEKRRSGNSSYTINRGIEIATTYKQSNFFRILEDYMIMEKKKSTYRFFFSRQKRTVKMLAAEGLVVLLLMQCAYPARQKPIEYSAETHEETDRTTEEVEEKKIAPLRLAIEQTILYREDLLGMKVGVVSNQTGMLDDTHLVDTLLGMGIQVTKVFAPEHGFRGKADAGEHVSSSFDAKTGLPIISLYGSNKKPSKEMMLDVEAMVFDIQDVGVRFYTYLSTLHYVMEACAEKGIPLYVLDRPNPNAHYIDGPVLEEGYTSFVGMHPVPIVYGMTIGEYAKMINGEGWLPNELTCDLHVVPLQGYWHGRAYSLPIAPSPNLKTDAAIQLYPSLCFFEATSVSVGRGTDTPFEVYGHPSFPETGFSFIPMSAVGAKNPLQENKVCVGYDLHKVGLKRAQKIDLSYFILAQNALKGKGTFITNGPFFNRLAGNSTLLRQLESGMSEEEIRSSWQTGLAEFKRIRAKYLMY